jgi:hypothetical protein
MMGDNGRIWFSGRMNKNTGEVISHYFGRLNQQQQRQYHHQPEEDKDHDRKDGVNNL